MIQIELPCCDTPVVLEPEAMTVRCEACRLEHVLAADARTAPAGDRPVDRRVPAAVLDPAA